MKRKEEPVLTNSSFKCIHLSLNKKVNEDINNFTVKSLEGKGVLDYLQQNAVRDENENRARTYLIYDIETKELAGYFTLKAGLILHNDEVDKEYVKPRDLGDSFESLSAIELAYFAVNSTYVENHPISSHYGTLFFSEFIYVLAKMASEIIGASILYGFSVNEDKLLKHYLTEYGFDRLSEKYENELHERFRPYTDDRCIFIYQLLDF